MPSSRGTLKRALEAARHPLGEGRGGMLRLDFNENTAGCSPRVCRALARLTPEEIATYPDAVAAHKRIARFYRVSPDELLLSNGADEALRLVFDAAVKPGDTILIAEPTFEMYRFYARLAHARVQAPRYDAEMKFPRSEYLRALRLKPKLALLANPNNPTGTLLDEKALSRIIRAARGTTLVLDEAYFEFSGVTALGWIRRHTNLVVIRTFSKAMGMAGLRLGCVLANRKFISRVREAKPPFSVNAAALHAAEAALGDRGTVRRYVAEVQNAKRMFEAALLRLGLPFYPSAGNFLLADLGPRAPKIVAGLERRGILVRDRSKSFGRTGPVRITIGTTAQMKRVIGALQDILRS